MQQVNLKEGSSADIIENNIHHLKKLFPDAFTEDGIDFNTLRQLLGDLKILDENEEKYGLNWHGKKQARKIALTPSLGTLLPCKEESVDWDNTKNLFIEGDNLEVLKLLQRSYANKVKMIYIDPPYNTGKEFVYPDKFQDNLDTYLKYTGQKGDEGERFTSNTESSGRKHTNWRNMMYPHLKLARDLLKEDGVIFISIDENEHTRLRSLMDEVFGQENFAAEMVWAAGRKNDARLVSMSHEYIISYAKNMSYLNETKVEWKQRKKGLEEIYSQHRKLKTLHNNNYSIITQELQRWYKSLPEQHPSKKHKHYRYVDAKGIYFPDNISWPGGGGPRYEVNHPVTQKPVKTPSGGWRISDPKKMLRLINDSMIHFGESEKSVPCIKAYLRDREYSTPYSVFYQDGRAATKRLNNLMTSNCFPFPKDELLIKELIQMTTETHDIILDFCSGSSTTAHAVMQLNAEDAGSRRHIMVQLPEHCDPKSEAYKAGYIKTSLILEKNVFAVLRKR